MADYVLFSILVITTFLIISFPIILDIINMRKIHEIIDIKGLTRRSITLSLVFIYVSFQIYFIIFNRNNTLPDEFKTIVVSVVAYYFGKSTALDDPNKPS
ncbi:hypothetical protein LGK95_04275 [Clostridium algoriphilum]|uniref:hypothetical protein n=1 Tax=Clostridium algoriphilum TaxID=198347 RepID=UPI001CF2DBA5|nr:hypothetical protein [Clostridium algoriphilum]MCB2292752.1 hypothetical protein [Clostridium algoriphilum]